MPTDKLTADTDPHIRCSGPEGRGVEDCGASRDPSESPDTGDYVDAGVPKFICCKCWLVACGAVPMNCWS